jgi:hypothetical protein
MASLPGEGGDDARHMPLPPTTRSWPLTSWPAAPPP